MANQISLSGVLVFAVNGQPVSNAVVEAWDKDLFIDDYVGRAETDDSGHFEITFDAEMLRTLFDQRPDIYFRILRNDRLLFDTRETMVVMLDQPRLEIKIEVPESADATDTDGADDVPENDKPDEHLAAYKPALRSDTEEIREGRVLYVSGSGWPDCPIQFKFSRKDIRISQVVTGTRYRSGVRPAADGSFCIGLHIGRTGAGELEVVAVSAHRRKYRAALNLKVTANPAIYPETYFKGGKIEKSYLRQEDFFRRRFGHIGFIPENFRSVQLESVRQKRNRKNNLPGALTTGFSMGMAGGIPVPGVCNWTPVGPACVPNGQTAGGLTISGRVLCIIIDATAPATMFIGTAGGGIWKSTDSGVTWASKSDYAMSMAIGSIAISPNNHLQLLAGTGEYHHNGIGGLTYYGNGLLRSTDGGETWTDIPVSGFAQNEVSRVLFDPTDATSSRAFLSSATGIYESPDGSNWNLLRAGSACELAAFEKPGSPGDVVLIGAYFGDGLWRAERVAGTWSAWTKIVHMAIPPAISGRMAMWQQPSNPQEVSVLFQEAFTYTQIIAQTPDGGSSWERINIRMNYTLNNWNTGQAGADNHQHTLTIPAADLVAAPAPHVYTSSSAGMPAHTHTFNFSAEDIRRLAGGGVINVWSQPDASGHTHQVGFSLAGQQDYNFVVAAHPTNANRLYIGNVGLWRTDNRLVFTPVSDGTPPNPKGLHADQHAFAFDPVNPEIVWAGNDGGVFRSASAGANWEMRNRDLATLQYMHISCHPQWENVIIGGTQDNGTHRYEGSPVWTFRAGGDGGFTAINQTDPQRMYCSYIYTTFYRSDNAGTNFGWISGDISAANESAEFYPPFELDPSAQEVCYFGGRRLWRSPDHGGTWAPVTADLPDNITGLAVHPADSTIIYAGTAGGQVYRIQRTGATWAVADVTTTNITDTGYNPGNFISDLAVDASGTVWVTFAAITWTEWSGEFSNNHVYRRVPGSMAWESRNNGLSMANPVNSIVIDPANANRLFIGTDLGVFRTTDAGANWEIWDEGLPNVPVFHLGIFGPLRLLRAGTHGRGVWERPIDSASCPLTDLYVRDNMLDSGRRNPSPEYVAHPFDPAIQVYHWQCADIKVDSPEGMPPTYQSPAAVEDYIFFESVLQHRTGKRGTTNRIYAQVHNRGVNKVTNVQMRLFFADAHAGLPPLPANFWTGTMPFAGTPGGTDWQAVGDAKSFTELYPGEPGVKAWNFAIPTSANEHSCLLLVVTCNENPLNGGGLFNVDQLVVQNKQVGLKNLQVLDAPAGSPMPSAPMMGMFGGSGSRMRIHTGNLPEGTRLLLTTSRINGRKGALAPTAEQLKAAGLKVVKDGKKYFAAKRETRCGDIVEFDLDNTFEAVLKPGGEITLPEMKLPAGKTTWLQYNLVLPKDTPAADYQFTIIQQSAKQTSGGCTYVVRVSGTKQK